MCYYCFAAGDEIWLGMSSLFVKRICRSSSSSGVICSQSAASQPMSRTLRAHALDLHHVSRELATASPPPGEEPRKILPQMNTDETSMGKAAETLICENPIRVIRIFPSKIRTLPS